MNSLLGHGNIFNGSLKYRIRFIIFNNNNNNNHLDFLLIVGRDLGDSFDRFHSAGGGGFECSGMDCPYGLHSELVDGILAEVSDPTFVRLTPVDL